MTLAAFLASSFAVDHEITASGSTFRCGPAAFCHRTLAQYGKLEQLVAWVETIEDERYLNVENLCMAAPVEDLDYLMEWHAAGLVWADLAALGVAVEALPACCDFMGWGAAAEGCRAYLASVGQVEIVP
jgi:hypothetical protein